MNLREAKASISNDKIIEIMKELGCEEYRDTTEALIFKTICHNVNPDDGSFKLYYYKKTKSFHCYTHCGDSFDIFELLKRRYELLNIKYDFFKDIVLKVCDNFRIEQLSDLSEKYVSIFDYKTNVAQVCLEEYDSCILNAFSEFYTPEWLSDGISEKSMQLFNILYSITQNKIIIPHYDIAGRLIGIRGRALNPEDILLGKYMPITIDEITYRHPLGYNLYGLNLNKENIKKRKIAFIFESEKSVLQYETMFGRENNIAVAACGSNITQYQFQLLNQLGVERIIICFDKEGATWEEKTKYYDKLKKMCKRNSNYCIMGFLKDKYDRLELKQSPTDRGPEVFKQLYKEGVVWI